MVPIGIATSLVFTVLLSFANRATGDDSGGDSSRDADVEAARRRWRSHQEASFSASGICAAENVSLGACESAESVNTLFVLQRTLCRCDDACHAFHDCCIDRAFAQDGHGRRWSCAEFAGHAGGIPVYAYQRCPGDWNDPYVRTLCEVESEVLGSEGSYMQDIPVYSRRSGMFYRNVFCSLCNADGHLVRWDSYFSCNGDSERRRKVTFAEDVDFSEAVYDPRRKSFRRSKVNGEYKNCRVVIKDFNLNNLLGVYNARLCKPAVDDCPAGSDESLRTQCSSYTSYVYEKLPSRPRTVYKNFNCALCNGVDSRRLRCLDPYFPTVSTGTQQEAAKVTLSYLFDFNFGGGNDNTLGVTSPCLIRNGQIWDPIHKRCSNYTCGAMFERKGTKCVPRVTDGKVSGINSTCLKRILFSDAFSLIENGSAYLNASGELLSPTEYEVYDKENGRVTSIAVCAEEGSYLLHLSRAQYWLSEITLSLSILCLLLHLAVYSIFKELRNCPGKILMSLSSCLICGHLFLLLGPHFKSHFWLCYVTGVATQFGYLSAFLWMSVMAFDIYRTFSNARSRSSSQSTFLKYSAYSWASALVVISVSVLADNVMPPENQFRPLYANPICWFNQRRGLIVFFILPVLLLLLVNISFFTTTAFHIRKVSKQTKMVNNFSDKTRYVLYIKLFIVFGLTWMLGLLAGLLRVSVLWYPFILLNGLQGVFIFISFTVKRKILKMLQVRFKINSESYTMGKLSGIKKAMYSSLSNLSSFQTTLSTNITSLEDNKEMLKAVRKLNPDSIIEDKSV